MNFKAIFVVLSESKFVQIYISGIICIVPIFSCINVSYKCVKVW